MGRVRLPLGKLYSATLIPAKSPKSPQGQSWTKVRGNLLCAEFDQIYVRRCWANPGVRPALRDSASIAETPDFSPRQ